MSAARLRALRPVVRLAARDARAHKARSLLAILLVAAPLVLIVGFLGTRLSTPPTRQAALASIPDGAQAVVTGTAVDPAEAPFRQVPEGAPGPWMDSLEQVPLSADELADYLPERDSVLQFWDSEDLLALADADAEPGVTTTATEADLQGTDSGAIGTFTLREADTEGLDLLLPPLTAGAAPADDADVVITTALAERTGVDVGETLALIAPPFSGGYSTNGRIAEVLQDSRRTYRVTGLVDADDSRAWALPTWLAPAVQDDPAGVDTHFLVTGPDPVTWETAKQLNGEMAVAVSRHVLTNYPEASELYPVAVSADYVVTALVMTVIACAAAAGLLLGLITPAFVVAAEQQRRTLALASAAGAAPRQLARTITLQGAAIGCLGGMLGAGGGLAAAWTAYRIFQPEVQALAGLPWWLTALAVAGAALAGWLATLAPARRVVHMEPVEALKRVNRTADASGPRMRGARRRWRLLGGLVILAAATGCGLASLRTPLPAYDVSAEMMSTPGTLPGGAAVPLLVAALLLGAVGLLMPAPVALDAAARTLVRGPLALRLAARDVVAHRGRALPVAGAIGVVTALACGQTVYLASFAANANDTSTSLVAPGYLALGPRVPVSEEFDAAVLADGVQALRQAGLPVTGSAPVWSDAGSLMLDIEPPASSRCPQFSEPDVASALGLTDTVTCVPEGKGYNPGVITPWMLGSQVFIMEPEALRATGLDGAQEAAEVLEAGGVLVNNAAWISADGTVRVGLSDFSSASSTVQHPQTRTGFLLRRMTSTITVSPATAAELGLTGADAPIYVGEMVQLSRPLTAAETATARRVVEERTDLVTVGLNWDLPPWGGTADFVVLAVLAGVALLALVLNLLLARTQLRGDLVTMHAVGASPRFLRRLMAAHAAVVLALGVPAGAVCGWAVAAYVVLWNRHVLLEGPWLRLEGRWGWQLAGLAVFFAAGMGAAWLLGGPPRTLERPRDD
ncbi:putative ABC transport system permease protein [Actinomyces ruminicola]|uniref:Putative ABC transport system permease protein n=1 Tax=Actinomyces ruminicola TaxID=332524 RepID=A0A1H0CLH8_9ACTO|nr:FtsX-like permease family protein [Actinomyces ruminicola]SDN58746.1 putative ABC transport system permease protein [Actinomyces ruminicola]